MAFLHVLVLLTPLQSLISLSGVAKQQDLMSYMMYHEAAGYCKAKETDLLEYFDITNTSFTPDYLFQLNDGQSAWIKGSATFSPFLNWIGCFRSQTSLQTYIFDTFHSGKVNLLFVCQYKCRYHINGYVGLNLRHCFCFPWLLDHLVQVDSTFCDIKCSDYSFEYCGGNDTVNLYQRVSGHFAIMPGLSAGQCIYIDALASVFLVSHPRTSSCLTLPPQTSVTYYICIRKARNCTANEERFEKYCLSIKTSEIWIEANEMCRAEGGNILFQSETSLLNNLRSLLIKSFENRTFLWLGIFRVFLPTHENDRLRDENACLSVKRLAHSFYIETDSCFAWKTFMCKPHPVLKTDVAVTNNISQDESRYARNVTEVDTSLTSQVSSIYQRYTDAAENNDSDKSALITVAIVQTPIIILICLFCFIYKKRNQKQRRARPTQVLDNLEDTRRYPYENQSRRTVNDLTENIHDDYITVSELADRNTSCYDNIHVYEDLYEVSHTDDYITLQPSEEN